MDMLMNAELVYEDATMLVKADIAVSLYNTLCSSIIWDGHRRQLCLTPANQETIFVSRSDGKMVP